jgi:hypothetical protein
VLDVLHALGIRDAGRGDLALNSERLALGLGCGFDLVYLGAVLLGLGRDGLELDHAALELLDARYKLPDARGGGALVRGFSGSFFAHQYPFVSAC